jgi:hypothetical protein
MRLHGDTWVALVIGLLVLLAANLWCWRPGIGGQPGGSAVELYYGWPATYRAEWWSSEDPNLEPAFLDTAPFFHPSGAMEHRVRSTELLPALADVAFAAAVLIIGTGTESLARGTWRPRRVIGLVIAAAVLAVVWVAAEGISAHL